jgi:hypothetical protein
MNDPTVIYVALDLTNDEDWQLVIFPFKPVVSPGVTTIIWQRVGPTVFNFNKPFPDGLFQQVEISNSMMTALYNTDGSDSHNYKLSVYYPANGQTYSRGTGIDKSIKAATGPTIKNG